MITLSGNRPVTALAFSDCGQRLAACSREEGTVRIWDSSSGDCILAREFDAPQSVAFSPKGDRLLVGSGTAVWRWNLRTDCARKVHPRHRTDVVAVGYLDNTVVSVSGIAEGQTGRLVFASLKRGGTRAEIEIGSPVYSLAVVREGGWIGVGTNVGVLRFAPESDLKKTSRLADRSRAGATDRFLQQIADGELPDKIVYCLPLSPLTAPSHDFRWPIPGRGHLLPALRAYNPEGRHLALSVTGKPDALVSMVDNNWLQAWGLSDLSLLYTNLSEDDEILAIAAKRGKGVPHLVVAFRSGVEVLKVFSDPGFPDLLFYTAVPEFHFAADHLACSEHLIAVSSGSDIRVTKYPKTDLHAVRRRMLEQRDKTWMARLELLESFLRQQGGASGS